MIIVLGHEKNVNGYSEYPSQWFDEEDPKAYLEKWAYNDPAYCFGPIEQEVLYLTAKKRKLIIVTYDDRSSGKIRSKTSRLVTPMTALIWLVNHGFDIPRDLMDFLPPENEI